MRLAQERISLREISPKHSSILLTEVELPDENDFIPLVQVWYEVHGVSQKHPLRLDMAKGVFIDHLEDQSQEAIIQTAAPAIVAVLWNYRQQERLAVKSESSL